MIAQAVKKLKDGGIVIFPTETFYGLAVDAFNEKALQSLADLKGRAETSPFPLLTPSIAELEKVAQEVPLLAREWMKKYWPGALTLVLKAPSFSKRLKNESEGVGFRISKHPMALQLSSEFGSFITSTSANPSGMKPASTPNEARDYFPNLVLIDGGMTPGGKPSTVVDFSTGKVRLIREGAVAKKELGFP